MKYLNLVFRVRLTFILKVIVKFARINVAASINQVLQTLRSRKTFKNKVQENCVQIHFKRLHGPGDEFKLYLHQ